MNDQSGSEVGRIPYGEETHEVEELSGIDLYIPRESARCHDCQVERGKLHNPGCDVEQCPVCGRQLIGCEHGGAILDECSEENGTPQCCPHCSHDGAFDGLGTREERFRRTSFSDDGRTELEVVQKWDQIHCPNCGEQFAMCRESTVPIPEEDQ